MVALLQKEAALLAAAVTYFTRLPVSSRHDSSLLNDSLRYLPLVGWIVGGAGAVALLGTSLILPPSLSALLSMVATMILTGALHEDGFADFVDGMGGGHTREDVLRIMKDPRMGAFGTIGLIMILAIKFFAILSLPLALAGTILIAAHSLSRAMAGSLIYFLPYARKEETAASTGRPEGKALPFTGQKRLASLTISGVLAMAPLVFLDLRLALILLAPLLPITWGMARTFHRRIGGYTGDCLGAVQQVTEVAIYLAALVALRAPWISI